MISRRAFYLQRGTTFALACTAGVGTPFLLGGLGTPPWLATLLSALVLVFAAALVRGPLSYRRYLAAAGEPLAPPPRWFSRPVLAALWGIGMLAMVLLWSIMAWGVAGPLRDTLLGLWLAIAATLLVATFLQRGWQRELAERDNAVEPAQPTRPAA